MIRSDARKRMEGDHQVHWDPAVREIVARERAAAKAEALRDQAREFREQAASAWGGELGWYTNGLRVAELAADWCEESAAAIEGADQ